MFPLFRTRHTKWILASAIALTLTAAFIAQVVYARVVLNTIDSVATVVHNGRQLIVTGPIACTLDESADVRVTVTQRSTGAIAEGRTLVTCTGENQQWEIMAPIQGNETFEPGPAIAVAVARTTTGGVATDAHQWLVNITIVAQ